MFVSALFDPLSLAVVLVIGIMILMSVLWHSAGRQQFHALEGGLKMLRRIGLDLAPGHPIRKRLESAPVVDLSFEEIAKLMTGSSADEAARNLISLRQRLSWIERFAQYSIHLGILGTVFALVSSDPTDLEAFRARLPLALGTTFWGLIGALVLSTVAGASETVLDRASVLVRRALLDALDDASDPSSVAEDSEDHPVVLETPMYELGDSYVHPSADDAATPDESGVDAERFDAEDQATQVDLGEER